jgi:hypothetical protein
MDLGYELHFEKIVVPAFEAFRRAEGELASDAVTESMQYATLREAGAACFYLHHYADLVFHEEMAEGCGSSQLGHLRDELARACAPGSHVFLLADVVNAIKHSHLTHRPENRTVPTKGKVLGLSKVGGAPQRVMIFDKDGGEHPLLPILHTVITGWSKLRGLDVPAL